MTEPFVNVENPASDNANPATDNPAVEKNDGVPAENNSERFIEYEGEKLEIPDNYWDEKSKAPNVGAILKAAKDLRTQISDKSPKDGNYKITVPEDLKDKIEADPESSLFKVAAAYAKEHKMSQEDFDQLTKIYFTDMVNNTVSDEDFMAEQKAELNKIYGKKASEVVSGIENWLKNSGLQDNDIIGEIQLLATTASGVKALEWFVKQSKGLGNVMPAASGDQASNQITEDQLIEMMKRPGYQDGSDKTLIKKIENGWKALYPDK